MKPFANATEQQIHQVASDMVVNERLRHLAKGFSCERDDAQRTQELAAAAAFYLWPSVDDPQVCFVETNGTLGVEYLIEYLASHAPSVKKFRADPQNLAKASAKKFDERIEGLTKGLALGLAELERLLRIRERRHHHTAAQRKARSAKDRPSRKRS